MAKYASWTIDIEDNPASAKGGDIELSLNESEDPNILYETSWGRLNGQRVAITGVCLFGANWIVEFIQQGRGNPPAKRSLSLPVERADAYKRIQRGIKVTRMFIPGEPNGYHDKLISWFVQKLKKLQPEMVLCHIPELENREFIGEFEGKSGLRVPVAYDLLSAFTEGIKKTILKAVDGKFEIRFINPMQDGGLKSVHDSWIFPYFAPETYGFQSHEIFGVEDLAELKIALEVYKQTNRKIPVVCGVIQLPHPYVDKTLTGRETVVEFS